MNIKTFAARIGVSTATVSRAFSNKGRISTATRARVREQARRLGYFPNRQARSMVRGKTDALALLYDTPQEADSDYYLAEVSYGIAHAAAQSNMLLQMHAVACDTAQYPECIADLVHTGSVDGFLVYLRTAWAAALIQKAEEQNIPYLILDNTLETSKNVLSIGDAIENACQQAGAYFRRIGKTYPAFVHGIHDDRKLNGFATGLGNLRSKMVRDPGGVSFEHARRAVERILEASPETDAVMCGNDVLAMGAIRGALDRGLRVPDDIAVIGCDDLALARYSNPALTTIRLPKASLGELAVKRLLNMIGDESLTSSPLPQCELILRESA